MSSKANPTDAHTRRRQTPALQRARPSREENKLLLIVCQGTVTEVEYFQHFKLATATVVPVGRAYDPEKLVQEALDLRDAAPRQASYDEVWCVFDKDDSTPQQFNAAILRAKAQDINVAYSNQAFEFWLLLHFDDHQGGNMSRELCGERVEKLIREASTGVSYNAKKGKHVSRELFDLLETHCPGQPGSLPRRKMAIRRAEAIAKRWEEGSRSPAEQESVTLVYRLVRVLQRHLG